MTDQRARIADLETQNRAQAEIIKRLWVKNLRQKKRIEIQQWIINRQNRPDAPNPVELAEALFRAMAKGQA